MEVTASDKAAQLERDFGIPHPERRLHVALRTRDCPDREPYHPVTPFHTGVGKIRIAGLEARGFEVEDAYIILLMRGARIETLASAAGEKVDEFAAQVQKRLNGVADLDPFIGEAQRALNMWWRS